MKEGQEAMVPKGKVVVFQLYWDEKGLGASQVCDAITLRPLSSAAGGADHFKQLLAVQELPGEQQLAELGKEMDRCLVCLIVLRSQAGSIIGQKGETVKALKEQAGVDRIYVENGPSDFRLVELKGTPSAVVAGILAIAERLAKEPPPVAGGPQPASEEIRLVVPDDGFGRVVGKGKAQLIAIQERCPGAKLEIAPRVAASVGMVQAISVAGEPAAAAEAIRLLVARIVTCCSALPLPRMPSGGAMGGPGGPPMGYMGATLMMHQASMPQGAPYGPFGAGKGSWGWPGKGPTFGCGYKGCGKPFGGGKPCGGGKPSLVGGGAPAGVAPPPVPMPVAGIPTAQARMNL